MICTVVPVKDEEEKIDQTLHMLLKTQTDQIIVVLNGCQDRSFEIVKDMDDSRIEYIYCNKPLGMDIPRAVGAWIAFQRKAKGIVFVDGDMNGDLSSIIDTLINHLKEEKADMVLTNCYPEESSKSSMARMLLSFRKQLNLELNLFDKIGYSIPSHGPHGISSRFLMKIPIQELAIPPVSLALAAKNNLIVSVAASIPTRLLQSTTRDEYHAQQITKTIIGDCIEAVQVYRGKERNRGYDGIIFTGYHKNRRFDLLETFIKSRE
ncbi:glycosyltransferase involved in cell wall biosynthesis [Anaerosolibacter carboniphilus]|uniref:Glycosyltransferase involved in cell wall biosynthesis n=1 Tax=Anaerosolibacter carboniphilus TaxID=1417629 RepID=A0A841KZI4_9FIRM|nr:glycosyltransferase [Anaerosolibacter carboniphilus]MBB6215549.1 glycosyltransferase involved in cell wall biosynthesis [Anaerosolibacter carboniphilus]